MLIHNTISNQLKNNNKIVIRLWKYTKKTILY